MFCQTLFASDRLRDKLWMESFRAKQTAPEYFVAPNKSTFVSGVDAVNAPNSLIHMSDNSTEIISDAIPDSDSSPVVITTDSSDLP